MKTLNILFILFIILFNSCTYFNEEELFPNQVCDTSNITYTIDIQPIFEQNCYLCHSTSTPVIYYSNLNLEDTTHIQRVIDNGKLLKNIKHEPDGIPMPQGGAKLSDCNINKIENWINNGNPFK
jgi:hypothetical protein